MQKHAVPLKITEITRKGHATLRIMSCN